MKKIFIPIFIILLSIMFFSVALYAQMPLGDIGKPTDYEQTKKIQNAVIQGFDTFIDQLPTYFNWNDQGVVTPAKNQGSCGSCWAFASVGAFESKLIMMYGSHYDLSEQQQISCNITMFGCCGGSMSALRFWETEQPIEENCTGYGDSGTSCPTGSAVLCASLNACNRLPYNTDGYYTVDTSDIDEIKASLYNDGPTYFRFNVYTDFITFWSNGLPGDVYYQTHGNYEGGHAVLIIGWDDLKNAWLCKNSWGATNGPNGDGTFWIAYSGHANNLAFGMANVEVTATVNASYSFSEGTGTITADDSGYGNDGIIRGATWTSGKAGYGLYFDGINDWVEVADDPSLDFIDQITVEAWVNLADLTDGGIIGKYDNYGYYNYCLWIKGGILYFEIGNRSTSAFETKVSYSGLRTGTWYHIVGTYDRQNVKLYVNALNVDTKPETREMGEGWKPLCIGNVRYDGVNSHYYNETNEFFRGKIDEVRIYPYALSAEHIYAQFVFNASYSFSEGAGTITADDGVYENHGIIRGATWTSGKTGYGLYFDGINDWVEVADDPSLDFIDQITVEAWVNLADLTDGGIIGKYDNYGYYNYCLWIKGGILYFEIGNRSTSAFETKVSYSGLSTGTWYHIVGTYDRQNVKLYVNALNVDTKPETREMGVGWKPLCIGNVRYDGVNAHSYNETNEFFRGKIDEVSIYAYALSAEQVYSRYISF